MDADRHLRSLIAHYLKEKGLNNTLAALELETNTKYNTHDNNDAEFRPIHEESLQSIIEDRINFQTIANQNSGDDVNTIDSFNQSEIIKSKKIILPNWSIKYPTNHEVLNLGSLNSLIINASYFHAHVNNVEYNLAIFVTNTKQLIVYDIDIDTILFCASNPFKGQPIKVIQGVSGTNAIILGDMTGSITVMYLEKLIQDNLSDVDDDISWKLTASSSPPFKLHRRLITDFKYVECRCDENPQLIGYFSSIGWDGKITLGCAVKDEADNIQLNLIGDFKLFTNPTSLLIFMDKRTNLPVVLVGRLESSLLTIFTAHSHQSSSLVELGKISLNDSEFSSHSFQPMCITKISSVNDDTIVTIATDHIPYMRLITVLIPSIPEILSYTKFNAEVSNVIDKLSSMKISNTGEDNSFQSKSPILRKYIISNFNSLSPQDKYSNAIILSRENCAGLWIQGDDGKLRGFDLRTGSVIETLNSNDGRAKSAFIGVSKTSAEVIVICGAVDRKISIWRYK